MLLGEVGFCRLDGRRKLDLVYIPRLDFRLHEIVHLAIKSATDDAEIADFVLQNDGLRSAVEAFKSRYLEKAAGGCADGAE